MAEPSARQVALAALRLWRTKKTFADSVTAGLFSKTELMPSERAFALELFYGVLRNLSLLDFWIRCLRAGRVDSQVRDLLRLGLYQLFFLATAQHAAVHETVELAPRSRRAVVNALLRAATRRRSDLRARADAQPLFVRMSHPQFLIERWQQRFGARHTEELCQWNNLPAPVYGRINRLKIGRDEFLCLYPGCRPLRENFEFVEFDELPMDAFRRGHCYIQDPSTVLACRLLDPKPGEKVLDACAAPGGKTGYLAQLMENRGTIVACDRDPERLQILKENITHLGARIVRVVRHDWTRARVPQEIAPAGPFDRILIDAPCTNTGVMRRRVDARWRLRPTDFLRMQNQQIRLVSALVPLLKMQGTLVYSTCSLEPEENEQVVCHILEEMSSLHLETERSSLPFRDHFDGAFGAKFVRTQKNPPSTSLKLHTGRLVE
jgi:16S rRNA (cytosine967-C5)-methyltransferase